MHVGETRIYSQSAPEEREGKAVDGEGHEGGADHAAVKVFQGVPLGDDFALRSVRDRKSDTYVEKKEDIFLFERKGSEPARVETPKRKASKQQCQAGF